MNGFLRLASCVPALRVGDPSFNAARILELYRRAEEEGAAIAVFPELSVTGYTCGDLFENRILLAAAERELLALARATEGRRALLVCGVPLRVGARLFNAAAVLGGGRVLGLPLKEYLPNYREFYEKRQFRSVREFADGAIRLGGADVPAGAGLVFACGDGAAQVRFGVEICEDLWSVKPPSADLALGVANLVTETIAMLSLFAAKRFNLKNVVLVGNLSSIGVIKDAFLEFSKVFDVNFTVPENARFGTGIGAALNERVAK